MPAGEGPGMRSWLRQSLETCASDDLGDERDDVAFAQDRLARGAEAVERDGVALRGEVRRLERAADVATGVDLDGVGGLTELENLDLHRVSTLSRERNSGMERLMGRGKRDTTAASRFEITCATEPLGGSGRAGARRRRSCERD